MDARRAYNYCIWLLARRGYSRAQLARKLTRKGADEAVIDTVLARLETLGFIDDEAYAETYVHSRRRKKGPHALRRELQAKGIDAASIEAALEPLGEAEQRQAARALLEKHAWRFRGEARKARARARAFLARRGYSAEVIAAVLEQVSIPPPEAADTPDDATER